MPNAKQPERPWTPPQLALLGKQSDRAVADKTSRTTKQVERQRKSLGIPPFRVARLDLTAAVRKLLGVVPDEVAAAKLGVSRMTVVRVRQKHNIPAASEPGRPLKQDGIPRPKRSRK